MNPRPTLIAVSFLTASVAAQPQWSPRFAFTGFNGGVQSITTFDPDGPGPRPESLYAGGWFSKVGDIPCHGLAAWNGKGWAPVPDCPIDVYRFFGVEPFTGRLLMVGEPDDAQYQLMYAWDGDTFNKIGIFDQYAVALDYWDADGDGPGKPLMVVGGNFTKVYGGKAHFLASWDGAKWAEIGGGIYGGDYAAVYSVVSWDIDGDGPGLSALIVAGDFTQVGDKSIRYLAKWNGTKWTRLGDGVDGRVLAAALFDDDGPGPGLPALYVSGDFKNAGDQPIHGLARFDGQNWTEAGSPDGSIYWLQIVDTDGNGPQSPRLIATGYFTSIGGQSVSNAAAWDGISWSPLGTNLGEDQSELAVFDADGPGPQAAELFTNGQPTDSPFARYTHRTLSRLQADSWRVLDSGVTYETFPPGVFSLMEFDADPQDDHPPSLMLAGNFAWRVQLWDGQRLVNAGADICCPEWNIDFGPYVLVTTTFDADGPGPEPAQAIIGGWFESINRHDAYAVARWDGSVWSDMTDQLGSGTVMTLCSADLDGEGPESPVLLAGGAYLRDPGGTLTAGIIRWDGAAWQAFDAGLDRSQGRQVRAIGLVDHDGDGPALPTLYAAGNMELTDHPESPYIARWDGERWQPVGAGLGSTGMALVALDPDGDGPLDPVLIVGGDFITAGGQPASRIAAWDGQQWSPLGEGTNGAVGALASVSIAGEPPTLYAGGAFNMAGGAPASNIASWDGSGWAPLGSGVDSEVYTIAVHDDDGPGPIAPALYFGGRFQHAGGMPSPYLARWGDLPVPTCTADCDGSGDLAVFDWLCFSTAFSAGDLKADCDASGSLDLFDYLCFVNAFNAGC